MNLFFVYATHMNTVVGKFLVRATTNEEAQSKVSQLNRAESNAGEPMIPYTQFTLSSEPVEWEFDVIPLR